MPAIVKPATPMALGTDARHAPMADRIVQTGRDANGRTIKRVWMRHPVDGRLEGVETHDPEGRVHAGVQARTVVVPLRASAFGMTPSQLAEFLTTAPSLRSTPRRRPSGLIV